MRHRIFIAINLPENIRKKLSDYELKWPELPCRWTKKENLHITLVFLGYLADEEMLEVCKTAKEVSFRHEPFSITLNKIVYGPPKGTPRSMSPSGSFQRSSRSSTEGGTPRMIWVEGEKSEELGKLQQDLEGSLIGMSSESGSENGSAGSPQGGKGYAPHITLARLKQWEFRKIDPEERPEIAEDISLNFEAKSIEVMESRLKREGPEYIILESCPLKN